MKIKAEDYNELKDLFITSTKLDSKLEYERLGLSNERFLWDCLYAVPDVQEVIKLLYRLDLGDACIFTAIKDIYKKHVIYPS